jgi:hypothetical protein
MTRDANDVLQEQGEEGVRALSDRAVKLNGAAVPLEYDTEIAITTEVTAIVKGVLHPGDIAVLYGASGVGKTFVAVDLSYHVALGVDWHGQRVRSVPVLLVILEGMRGARHRMVAYREKMGSAGPMLARLTIHTPLDKTEAGKEGEAAIIVNARAFGNHAGRPVGLIVIDTLARAIAGDDENSAQDITAFVGRASAIARETGACVLIIHHPGKDDARGMRGSSALFAACDAVIKITEQDEKRFVSTEKVKDGPLGDLFAYRLDQVTLGTDEDGDTITSCVVVEIGSAGERRRGRPRKVDGDAVLKLLRQTIEEDGESAPGSNHIPQGIRVTTQPKFKTIFGRGIAHGETDEAKIHRIFGRELRRLQNAEKIGVWREYLWVTTEKTEKQK